MTLTKKTKRGRERILAVLLAAMLILSCLPAVTAFGDVGDAVVPAAPALNPNGGSIDTSATVTIEAGPAVGQAVYYTIAAGDTGAILPVIGSVDTHPYTAPFAVSSTAGAYTVNAAVYDADTGLWSSAATTLFLVVNDATGVPAAPALNPNGGSIDTSATVSIEAGPAATVSQAVYYTTDGSRPYLASGTPLAGASVYAAPFSLPAGAVTVNAAMYDAGTGLWSSVATASFDVGTSGGGTPATVTFSDVSPSYWAYGVIGQLSTAGYIYGYPDGSFQPDSTVTRAEFVTIIDRVLELQPSNPATPDFNDVSPTDWFYVSVENSFKAGLIQGYGDGIFDPGRTITREELAAILVNALGKKDEAAASISGSTAFTDDAGISAWARGSIVVAVKYGLLKGYPDGSFQPQGKATRAETSALISNFLSAKGGSQ